VTGATKDWKAWENWNKEGLIRKYGNVKLKVAEIPYAGIYGQRDQDIEMTKFIEYMELARHSHTDATPLYTFDGQANIKMQGLEEDFVTPPMFHFRKKIVQFILGPPLSGAPPHYHGHAFNALIYGEKKVVYVSTPICFLLKKKSITLVPTVLSCFTRK